jgi:hypothetical protein
LSIFQSQLLGDAFMQSERVLPSFTEVKTGSNIDILVATIRRRSQKILLVVSLSLFYSYGTSLLEFILIAS